VCWRRDRRLPRHTTTHPDASTSIRSSFADGQAAFTYGTAVIAKNYGYGTHALNGGGTPELTRVLDRTQDNLLRPTGFQLLNGNTLENQSTYTYSPTDGRIATISGGGLQPPSPANTFTYGYQANSSNLIKTLPTANNYVVNNLNQYSNIIQGSAGVSPAYDFDCNATSYPLPAAPASNSTFVWDAENRLISTTVGTSTTTYQYDTQSRRIARSVGVSPTSSSTLYLYDAWNPIAEYSYSSTSQLSTLNHQPLTPKNLPLEYRPQRHTPWRRRSLQP